MRDVFGSVLRYKIWFDLWGARQRTLQAVLTIAIGAFAVGTVFGSQEGVQRDARNSWLSVAQPAILLRVAEGAPYELLATLERRADLEAVTFQMEQAIEWRPHADAPWRAASLVARNQYESEPLGALTLEAGSWPSGRRMAVERNFPIHVGDQVEFRIGERELRVPITGVVYNRSGFPAGLGGDPAFYATRAQFTALTGQTRYQVIRAAVPNHTPERATATARALQHDLEQLGLTVLPATVERTLTTNPSRAWFYELIDGAGVVLQIIGIIAMALSLLLIYTTVTAIITQQTGQIGELKAIGASSRQIIVVYVTLVLTYGVLAMLISVPAALLAANALRGVVVAQLGITPGPFSIPLQPMLMQAALCVLAPLAVAFVPILQGARITVREAISSYGLSSTGSRIDEWLGRLEQLSRIVSLAVSNALRNWRRLILTQLTLGGAGVTLVAVMSTQASMLYSSGSLFRGIYTFPIQLDFDRPQHQAQIDQILQHPDVTRIEVWRTITPLLRSAMQGVAAPERAIQINAIPLPSASYQPQMRAGRWLTPDDTYAVVLSDGVASELGVGVGDRVIMRIPAPGTDIWASEREWIVVGLMLDPNVRNLSRMGIAPFTSVVAEAGGGTTGNRVQIQARLAQESDALRVADELRTFYDQRGIGVQTTRNDTVYQRSTNQSRNLTVLTTLLMSMAVIISAVGGIALSGVLSISVLERRREIGVLRAIGAPPEAVRLLFIIEGLILGWMSWLIALAFSYPAGEALATTVAGTVGLSIVFQYSWEALAIWLALASLIGVLASLSPAQSALNVSVQESLSYE